MARQNIDIGVQGNDGTGDSIRESFRKVNENFTQLYAIFGAGDRIAFTDLDDAPASYAGDQVIVSNVDGTALLAKDIVGGTGIQIDNSDENELRIIATGGDVSADEKPSLGGHLDASGFAIVRTADPDDALAEDISLTYNIDITADDMAISRGYADQRYLQSTGGPGAGGQIRVRDEPVDTTEYTKIIEDWSDGYAVITEHGFNSGSNGIRFIYNATITPATGLTTGVGYYLRFIDGDRLGVYATRPDAINNVNRIVVNQSPEIITRGLETFEDFYFDDNLAGNWVSNEALPRNAITRRQGDTMEGPLFLYDHPGTLSGVGTPSGPDDLQAATKYYVDNSSFASDSNLFVSTSGDDAQTNTPAGKEGRAFSYAYATVGAACKRAEEIINESLTEPGPYRQVLTYGNNANFAYLDSITTGIGNARTLNVFTNGGGVDQSKNVENRDLREGSIIKGMTSGATARVTAYNGYGLGPGALDDEYEIELLHKITDKVYFKTDYRNSASRLEANKDFIKAEVVKFIQDKYPSLDFDANTCGRDVGYIVDAIVYDIRYGGNIHSIDAGRAYYNGVLSVLPLSQKAPTVDGINYLNLLAQQVIANNLIPASVTSVDFGTRQNPLLPDYIPQNTSGLVGEEKSAVIIDRLIDGIINIVQNGINGDGITIMEFIEDEQLEFGQPVPEAQITIRVESGIYYEQLPIRVPTNVSIKGDEFRRSIIRPAPGVSQSPWAEIYFYRDETFDNLTRTYTSSSLVASTNQKTSVSSIGNGSLVTVNFVAAATVPFPSDSYVEISGAAVSAVNGRHKVVTGSVDSITFDGSAMGNVGSSATIKGTVVTISGGTLSGLESEMYMTVTGGTGEFESATQVTRIIDASTFEISRGAKTALSSATIQGLNGSGLAPTGQNFGYHYLTDPSGQSGVFTPSIAKTSGHTGAAAILTSNKASIRTQVISYINATYPDLEYNETTCSRDVGLIIDAVIYDITNGGVSRTLNAGHAYRRNASARISITTQLTETLAGIGHINTLAQALLSAAPTPAAIVADLISGIQNIIIGTQNPAKANKDMDVFLLNDGTILRNITAQGHGGFMCVLDPEGQIQTKSPYFQTATCLSGSVNKQSFRGGMFIDGFSGNLPASITSVTNPTLLQVAGLTVRAPGLPTSFVIDGTRYQVNGVSNYDRVAGTATIKLDDSTPFPSATVTCTNTSSSGNLVTCDNTNPLSVNMAIRFTGTTFGNILNNVTYYVRTIFDDYTFTLSTSFGGGEFTLSTSAGTMTTKKYIVVPQNIIIETPGNRSMLANDFTQVNDLGYGVVAVNNGLSELVSVFTYYNWTSYYALNGAQIRSLNGSSCNGVYGLRASGRDPNEIPDPVSLADNTLQMAKIFKRSSFAARNTGGETSLYIDYYDFIPYNVSEIEIDHTPTRQSAVENTPSISTNITVANPGSSYLPDDILTVTGGTVVNSQYTQFRVISVTAGAINQFEMINPGTYSIPPTGGTFGSPITSGIVSVTGGAGLGAQFNINYLGTVSTYEVSTIETTSNTGSGVDAGGVPGTRTVLRLNLNTGARAGLSTALTSDLVDGQNVIIRSLQNMRFNGVENVIPVRPSTALEFTSAYELNAVYRTLAYGLTFSTGGALTANQSVLTFDNSFNYTILQTNPTKLGDTDYVSGGLKTMGATAGDTRIAVFSIANSATMTRLNSGEMILPINGRLHIVEEYVAAVGANSAYITVSEKPYGEGSITPVTVPGIEIGLNEVRVTNLRAGLQEGESAEITVNISTCRATGHDFLDVGSGGFNSTNYPSNIYGRPASDPEQANEVIEETQGRVFYVSTDQDGIFRVGPFFTVDQGTGTVTFAASIALSNLDGIGFKRGVVAKEFSTDSTFTDNADDAVPVESAVQGFIDKRLGFTRTGAPVAASERIPVGGGFLPTFGSPVIEADLSMGASVGHRITNLTYNAASATDAATIGYVDEQVALYDSFSELKEINVMSPTIGDLAVFSGSLNNVINATVSGDIGLTLTSSKIATLDGGITLVPTIDAGITGTSQLAVSGGVVVNEDISTWPASGHFRIDNEIFKYTSKTNASKRFDNVTRAKFTTIGAVHAQGANVTSLEYSEVNLQIQSGVIVNADVSASAAIDQSKLNLSDASTTGTKGISSFSATNFDATTGLVSIKTGGVQLANVQNIAANTVLGNITASAAAPQAITTSSLVTDGIASGFTSYDAGGDVLTRQYSSLKTTSTFVDVSGISVSGSGTFSAIPVSSLTGTGHGAIVDVGYGSTPNTYSGITVLYGGSDYSEGDQLIIDGSLLGGGVSGVNDLTFTVQITGSNIDASTHLALTKVSQTAEVDSVVRTGSTGNLGTTANRFGTVYADTFNGEAAINGGTVTNLSSLSMSSGIVQFSITSGIASAGSSQASATALTTTINIISTVVLGQGVRLPVAAAGNMVIIKNNGVDDLILYPASGASINGGGTNDPITLPPGSSLQFFAGSATEWYSLNATFA